VRARCGLTTPLQWHRLRALAALELPGGSLLYGKWSTGAGRADDARPHRSRRAAAVTRAHPGDQLAGGRDRRAGRPARAAAFQRAWVRAADRRQARRRDRRPWPLASDAKLARAAGPAPIPISSGRTRPAQTRPRRQPPHQRGHTPRRCHPRPLPSRDHSVRRPQEDRGHDPPRSDPLPQAPPRTPNPAPAARAPPALSNGSPPTNRLTKEQQTEQSRGAAAGAIGSRRKEKRAGSPRRRSTPMDE
jgi:hypothetical protein